ncbi:MAG: DUF4304 domain-containing protein [Chloroflexi bacterium]|nr:DUF4304 domain-containing protein [Chloroflexota bacterium]
MIDKKTFKKSFAAPLEGAGFVKRGQTWYLEGKDVITAINLQKSDWSEMYYINVGFWLKSLENAEFFEIDRCHLQYRVERLFPEKNDLIITSCSLEESDQKMLDALSRFLEDQLIPFLMECQDEKKLRDLLVLGNLNNGFISGEARQHLSSL